ncbi:DUF637 domain-containing protein [Photorhabdus caribbeanensis]
MQAGQNLILTTETLRGQGEIRAGSDVTVKASHLSLYGGKLKAGNHVLLQGEKNLTVYDTNISGHDITLISSGGGISVSSGGGNSTAESTRPLSTISAANTLHILSEQGISLSNTLINRAKNIFLAGNGRVDINHSLDADENIELHTGTGANLGGISLTAGKDITLNSGHSLDIGKVAAGNNLIMIAGRDITHTKAILSAEGAVAIAENSTALHSAEGKYIPVTSELIDLGLGNAPWLTINIPEIAGGMPGIKLADKQARVAVRNNLPIVHIAAPNLSGVSHNYYQEFNVGALGLVLNNATGATQSVLAGPIKANPHFNGKSADLIINEVVGTLTSNLQGLLEVVGQKASVFIANPNGITCDGCGFVNTPTVTLSTGKPVFDKDGALAALAVKKGTITFGEKGLDATAQNDVDIISRAAILNGKVQAKNLTLTQGPSQVDLKHGTIAPIAGEGDSPWKAIDTGSLGGMYANQIRLVSTEPGKEVNLANLTATQGDISLTADGKVTLGDVQAKTDITVNGKDIETTKLTAEQGGISLTASGKATLGDVQAQTDISVNGKDIETTKLTTEQGGISLTASGKATLGDVQAQTDISVNGKDIETTKLTTEQGGISLTASGKATLGDVQAKTDITVNSKSIETAKQSHVQAGKDITLATNTLDNKSKIIAEGNMRLFVERLDNQGNALLQANNNLWLQKDAIGNLNTWVNNYSATLKTNNGDIVIRTKELSNVSNANLASGANAYINATTLNNSLSQFNATKNLILTGSDFNEGMAGKLSAKLNVVADFINKFNGTSLISAKNILLHAGEVIGMGYLKVENDLSVIAEREINVNRDILEAKKNLTLIAGKVTSTSKVELKGENVELIVHEGDLNMGMRTSDSSEISISAYNNLRISAGNDLDFSRTQLDKLHNITLSAGHNLNAIQGKLNATGNINLFAGNDLILQGANINADQQVMLSANGKMDLGNVKAKTDLNVGAKELCIGQNVKVHTERDIVLASSILDNKGSIIAGQDMRIFGDKVYNIGDNALLQANNNMWIQKNAQGDKSHLIENRSATIKTNKGDLVARSHKMLNIRDLHLLSNIKPEKNSFLDFSNVDDLSDMRNWFFIENYDSSLISSGGNLYINSDNLLNINSEIHGKGDVFLTGSHFKSTKFINTENLYNGNTYPHFTINSSHPVFNNPYYKYRNQQENGREIHILDRNNTDIKQQDWNLIRNNPSNEKKIDPFTDKTMLSSGRNLVIDFLGEVKITSNKALINENELNTPITPSWKEKTLNLLNAETDDIKVKNNLILNANGFTLTSARLNAEKDINIISSDANFVELTDSKIISKSGDLSILSTYYKAPYEFLDKLLFPSAINILSTVLKGHNVSLISKNSGILSAKSTKISFGPEIDDRSNIINSSGDLTLHSGTNLNLNFVNYFTKNKNTTLTAARDIKINTSRTSIDSSESISINGGIKLDIGDVKLIAGKDVILNSAQDSRLWGVPITANSISISTGKDLNVTNSALNATENILMNSGGDLNLSAAYGNVGAMMKEGRISHITSVNAGNELTLIANDNIKLEGSSLISKGDMTLTSGGYTYLKSAVDTENTNSRSSITHKEARLNSGKNLTILTGEGLLFQATKLLAKGVIDIAAKGGYLYAQAQEDVTEYTTSSTKRKWYGKKKTSTTTHHSVTNKVTEFIADGDINLLSRDDSTYEASKIETNKNARLTSTHGKINFKAVKDSSFEQTISQSKGFFIKNRDSGHRAETWVLPSVHIGGKLTIEAANGISADIKTQKGQSLQTVLAALGNTSETAWLKQLSQRQDVNWNEVQDAYENWDHKSQHLNPVVSAVIAISVAVVTAGAGVTVAAASGAAGAASGAATAAGASAATAATVSTATYGAVSAGISSLASTAAVKLINNKGNLSKTLKDMGNSETVKSTVTSMAIGGALAGFDNVMGWDKAANGAQIDPAKATLPKLSNGDWSKVAQRVAGQSIISSSLGTAISGGSFKDNFTTALLANIGSQINAEGAGLIGKNGQVLGLPGKAISHAAVSALAAEIGGGDAKGAAAGALAAELAAITLDKTFNDPMKIQAGGKIIGSVAGAIATNSAKGANSGANAGEIVILFNHLNSMNAYNLVRELQEANKQGAPTEAIWNKYNKLSTTQRAEMLSHCAGNGGLCTLTYQAEMDGGIKTADAISGLRWMFGLSEEDSHRISQFVTTENQNDLGLLYNSLPAWEKGALIAKEVVESAGIGGAIGGKASVASIVGKSRRVGNTIGSSINVEHVFHGEINRRGNAVGFHHEAGIGYQGKARITAITAPPNAQGIYRGKIEVFNPQTGQWVQKGPESTFFPQSWSRQQIMSEIRGAHKNATIQPNGKWEGVSPSGVKIGGYLDNNGNINTAFPVYER